MAQLAWPKQTRRPVVALGPSEHHSELASNGSTRPSGRKCDPNDATKFLYTSRQQLASMQLTGTIDQQKVKNGHGDP